MQSFQTEIEQAAGGRKALVEKDIVELGEKIQLFREGKIDPEKFRSLRLARGVYGQRQPGVQMIRIKLPYGKLTPKQLLRIADVSDTYSNGKLHLTTRQDIQIHFVSLDRTPQLWAELEEDDITLREACGNTVRNVTASPEAGIDPLEPFDVTPYAEAVFQYFLRNPVCQELGRKIKIAFSSNDEDTAYVFMHDLGFIPKVRIVDGQLQRGFRAFVGGGLGAQPFLAQVADEFLASDQLIPFIEAVLRVFDRHGERTSRHKARIKYLVQKTGIAELKKLVEEERVALKVKSFPVDVPARRIPGATQEVFTTFRISDDENYRDWFDTNVIPQKQDDWYAVRVKVQLGNLDTRTARIFAGIAEQFSKEEIHITPAQGFLLRFVPQHALPALYRALQAIGFAGAGAESTAHITACPGTDTCNLGISSSTGIAKALEQVITEEFPELVYNHDIKIKISGCMNSCGQHSLAQIGFHGSSFKAGTAVVPALQVLLGGGPTGNGEGRISEKIIKVPSKRGPAVLKSLLHDFETNAVEGEYFNSYYDRRGKEYFYQLLKPLADNKNITPDEFTDWGQTEQFQTAIGVGECAGVLIDLVQTLFFEAEEKLDRAEEAFAEKRFADSVYYSYSVFVNAAKGLLLSKEVNCNTHHGILGDFDKHFVDNGDLAVPGGFRELVLQINKNEPTEKFARSYLMRAAELLAEIIRYREKQTEREEVC
ncbi:MAG: sulfite reductase (NADPH) hemoprotein beta-component [Bacteroidetes bacterium]|nr:MAG: sulfite reductase (NADPH) hemoprotein beta-component [Bacteroidota bacterium]